MKDLRLKMHYRITCKQVNSELNPLNVMKLARHKQWTISNKAHISF